MLFGSFSGSFLGSFLGLVPNIDHGLTPKRAYFGSFWALFWDLSPRNEGVPDPGAPKTPKNPRRSIPETGFYYLT